VLRTTPGQTARARLRSIPTLVAIGGLVIVVVALILATLAFGLPGTGAIFTNDDPIDSEILSGRIFPDDRDTPAFSVSDASGGTAVDASSVLAFASDGRVATTSQWAATFVANRYVDFDFNAPLPAGLDSVTASFRLRGASATGGSTSCYYLEVRRRSDNSIVQTIGSPGSPVGCLTGTTLATGVSAISVGTTDLANDLRIRVYGTDSSGGSTTIDMATITGDYTLATFTLYPTLMVDSADTTPGTTRWGPAGP